MIYDDLAYKEEAHIFADQQKNVKKLTPYETFVAHIEAGDAKQAMIKAVVESYGLRITPSQQANGIAAITALEYIYDKYGQNTLDSAIHLAVATWEGERYSLSGTLLKGIARILVTYGDSINEDIFVEKLSKMSVKQIVRTAKDRHPGQLGYSEAILMAYNNKNKYRLSMRALYGKKADKYELEEDYE